MRKIIDNVYRSKHPKGVFQSQEELLTESYFQGTVADTSKFKAKINKVEDTGATLKSHIDSALNNLNKEVNKDNVILACLVVIQTIEEHLARPLTYFVYRATTAEVNPVSAKEFFYDCPKELVDLYEGMYNDLWESYESILGTEESKKELKEIADF